MRLHDIERNYQLFEVTLNQQQIANLFAAVATAIERDPVSSNRTLLGNLFDKITKRTGDPVEQTWKHLEKQIKFSTALPTVGPEFEKHVAMIMKNTGNDPAIKSKFDSFDKTMLTKPKSQKFMLDVAQSVSGLSQSGVDNQQIVNLLGRVEKLINASPLGMAQAGTPPAAGTPQAAPAAGTPQAAPAAAVTEAFSLKLNKITRDQLISKWEAAGRPPDSVRIATVLLRAGVGQDQLDWAYNSMGLETPSDMLNAPGRRTPAAGGGQPSSSSGSRSSQAAPAKIRDYASAQLAVDTLFSQLKQLTAGDQGRVVSYVNEKIRQIGQTP